MKPFPEMLKKEQIVVVLLAGILLLIIAMPVKKKDTEEQTAKSTPCILYTSDPEAGETGAGNVFPWRFCRAPEEKPARQRRHL